MRVAAASLLLANCAAAASAEPFEIVAYEAPGIEPVKGEIILRDARKRIPELLKSCGLKKVQTVDATDGVVLFRFTAEAGSAELKCVKEKLPAGTQLHQAAYR